MLTKGDDFPIHQLPEPIAYAGTDRNFYDRYFFNGYSSDGRTFFAVAFGVYPHLNVADAHFAVIRNDVEHCIHASRILNMERMDLQVGPIRIEVIEPLQKLRIVVEDELGIAADLLFEGRAFPIEEPRFVHRNGPRAFMDYTRMTQNGRCSGWISVDGVPQTLPPGSMGTRDRSWGIRPVGMPDSQPLVPSTTPGFFWQWTPINLPDRSVFFHINADATGQVWNLRAAIVPEGGGYGDIVETRDATMETKFESGTRHPVSGVLIIRSDAEPAMRITFEPLLRFQMKGIGYIHPKWGHGRYHGERVVEREDFRLADIDRKALENLHVQMLSRVKLEQDGHVPTMGMGVFEQVVLGPYAPFKFTSWNDFAP